MRADPGRVLSGVWSSVAKTASVPGPGGPERPGGRGGRAVRVGGSRGWSAAGRLLRAAPTSLLAVVSVCVWWMSVPRLLGMELPSPIAPLGACLLVPLAVFRHWALVTTDGQVKRGEEIRPVLDAATAVLAASAVLLAPALAIAWAFGCPVLSSVGLVLASDLGAVLLGAAVVYLAGSPA